MIWLPHTKPNRELRKLSHSLGFQCEFYPGNYFKSLGICFWEKNYFLLSQNTRSWNSGLPIRKKKERKTPAFTHLSIHQIFIKNLLCRLLGVGCQKMNKNRSVMRNLMSGEKLYEHQNMVMWAVSQIWGWGVGGYKFLEGWIGACQDEKREGLSQKMVCHMQRIKKQRPWIIEQVGEKLGVTRAWYPLSLCCVGLFPKPHFSGLCRRRQQWYPQLQCSD